MNQARIRAQMSNWSKQTLFPCPKDQLLNRTNEQLVCTPDT
jgi:hypothetical protein